MAAHGWVLLKLSGLGHRNHHSMQMLGATGGAAILAWGVPTPKSYKSASVEGRTGSAAKQSWGIANTWATCTCKHCWAHR